MEWLQEYSNQIHLHTDQRVVAVTMATTATAGQSKHEDNQNGGNLVISSLTTVTGAVFSATTFVDATYEGWYWYHQSQSQMINDDKNN